MFFVVGDADDVQKHINVRMHAISGQARSN